MQFHTLSPSNFTNLCHQSLYKCEVFLVPTCCHKKPNTVASINIWSHVATESI